MVSGVCLDGVWSMSEVCLEYVWMVSEVCLEVDRRLSEWCPEIFLRVFNVAFSGGKESGWYLIGVLKVAGKNLEFIWKGFENCLRGTWTIFRKSL